MTMKPYLELLAFTAILMLCARPAAGGDLSTGNPDSHNHTSRMPASSLASPPPAQTQYTCVMHPHIRMPMPGPCPICSMPMIPVIADDVRDETGGDKPPPELRLSARAAALLQVKVLPVERRELEVPVHLFGRLEHDETRLRTISAWVPGRLEKLHVSFTGVTVRVGEPLVEIYSPLMIAAQEELLQALRTEREVAAGGSEGLMRDSIGLTLQASRERLQLLGLEPRQVAQIEQQGRINDLLTIPAPVSGVVMERLVSVGDYVETGTPLYRLADLSSLWAQLEVYESDLQWLQPGQPAHLTAQALPGEQFHGSVAFIEPVLGDRTRTTRIRVEVANPEGSLKPGMFIRGVVLGSQPRSLVIPASAPLLTGRRAVVYVQRADTAEPTYEPRNVLLGARAGEWYVVREGLDEGDLVVINGAFKLDSELQIRGQPSMMQPEGGGPAGHDHGGVAEPGGGPEDHRDHDP